MPSHENHDYGNEDEDGAPRGELFIARLPRPLQKIVLGWLSYIVLGNIDRRGLPRPDHALLSEPPIINSLLFHLLEHGRVTIAPGIERLDGDGVVFKDGRREIFDTILWATGYRATFPFLEDGHIDWADGVPLRFGGGAIAARTPGLYFNGLASPRGGNLPMHSACAELIAECVVTQRLVGPSLHSQLRRSESAAPLMDGSVREIIEDARRVQRIVAKIGSVARNNPRREQRLGGSSLERHNNGGACNERPGTKSAPDTAGQLLR